MGEGDGGVEGGFGCRAGDGGFVMVPTNKQFVIV